MKIFLTGFMASGKSYLGKELAAKLRLPFFDLDNTIEEQSNKSITELFNLYGESGFRKIETTALNTIIKQNSDFVMGCGGGTTLSKSNMQLINASGLIIFINTPINIILERLKKEKNTRPLVSKLSDKQFKPAIKQLYSERLEIYKSADITINNIYHDQAVLLLEIKEMYELLIRIGRIS